MKVKDMVKRAAECLGREELACAVDDTVTPTGELAALMRCYNLVENEIALDYFPLKREETFEGTQCLIPFSAFSDAPIRIHGVRADGLPVRYECLQDAIRLARPVAQAIVSYSYSPAERGWEDEICLYRRISPRLIAYGMAAEFCLTGGMYAEASLWDGKYRDALRAAGVAPRRLAVRPRRWR